MEIISLPQMRNAQLQSLGESVLLRSANIVELEPVRAKVESALALFKQGMQKDNASAADKKVLDSVRDKLISGLWHQTRAEKYFPHGDAPYKASLEQFVGIVEEYHTGLTRKSYNEESVAIDNMVSELNQLDLESLQETNLPRWVSAINEANAEFKAVAANYVTESVAADSVNSASEYAPQLYAAIKALITMVYAYTNISDDEKFVILYKELDKLVDAI